MAQKADGEFKSNEAADPWAGDLPLEDPRGSRSSPIQTAGQRLASNRPAFTDVTKAVADGVIRCVAIGGPSLSFAPPDIWVNDYKLEPGMRGGFISPRRSSLRCQIRRCSSKVGHRSLGCGSNPRQRSRKSAGSRKYLVSGYSRKTADTRVANNRRDRSRASGPGGSGETSHLDIHDRALPRQNKIFSQARTHASVIKAFMAVIGVQLVLNSYAIGV